MTSWPSKRCSPASSAKSRAPRWFAPAEPGGFDADLWRRVCETGAPGMGVAESAGGGGAVAGRPRGGRRRVRSQHRADPPDRSSGRRSRRWRRSDQARDRRDRWRDHRVVCVASRGRRRLVVGARRIGGRSHHRARRRRVGGGRVRTSARRVPAITRHRRSPIVRPRVPARCSRRETRRTRHSTARLNEWKTLTAAALVGVGAQSLHMALDYVQHTDPVRQADRRVPGSATVARRSADPHRRRSPARAQGGMGRRQRSRGRARVTSTSTTTTTPTSRSLPAWRSCSTPTVPRTPRIARCTSTAATGSPRSTTSNSSTAGRAGGRSVYDDPARECVRLADAMFGPRESVR